MRSWKVSPQCPQVAKFIDCYWLLEKQPGDTSPCFPKLNPDPAAHLIIASKVQPFRYSQQHSEYVGAGCHLIYPHKSTFVIDHSAPFLVVGIKFKVGALYALKLTEKLSKNNAAIDLLDSIESVAKIAPLADICWLPIFAETLAQPEKLALLLDAQLQDLVEEAQWDRHSLLVSKILPMTEITKLSVMAAQLDCSVRTLERSFSKVTGFSIKQYQSMNRLEAVLQYLYQRENSAINWSDVAVRFGFSDQPHLIHTIKTALGATPGSYAKKRDLTIDAYGNFE